MRSVLLGLIVGGAALLSAPAPTPRPSAPPSGAPSATPLKNKGGDALTAHGEPSARVVPNADLPRPAGPTPPTVGGGASPAEKALTLAELMRVMTAHTERIRPRVAAGRRLGRMPKAFEGLPTAEPTAAKMKGEHFDAFASAYLAAARQLHDPRDPEPKREVYNRMISTCLACHTQYCPGPLARIKKLPVE